MRFYSSCDLLTKPYLIMKKLLLILATLVFRIDLFAFSGNCGSNG